FANNTTVSLTALPSNYYLFNGWNGTVASTNNPLSLPMTSDVTETPSFVSFPFTEGFESGNLLHLGWVTQGDAPWFVQSSVVAFGQFSARSGQIGNSQSSSLILTTNFTSGTVVFDIKVSSEELFDGVTFSIDGIPVQEWSGEQDWA